MNQKFYLAADSSQIVEFLTCPQSWQYSYQKNIVHKYTPTEAMDWGTIFHGMLERYYQAKIDGADWMAAQTPAYADLEKSRKKFKLSEEDFLFIKQRFLHYVCFYMQHDFIPLQSERGFSIPIYESEDFYFVLEGRIDLIATTLNRDTKLILDTKTQARESLYYPRSIQFKNYCLATGLNHCVINYVRWHKELKDNTFERKSVYFSNKYLMDWKHELISIFFKMAHAIIIKQFEHRLSSCQNFGWGRPCQFVDLCDEKNDAVRNGLIQINYMDKPKWEPWTLGERNAKEKTT